MVMWKVYRVIFNVFFWMYMLIPVLVIPWWAYHYGNWWLLLGILASYIGTFSNGKLVAPALVFMPFVWWHQGFSIYQWATYLWVCLTFGGVTFMFADAYQDACKEAYRQAMNNVSD